MPFFSRADPQTDAQPPALPQPGQPEWVNPHPPGTYEHFVSEPGYRKTYNVYRNHDVLNSMAPESASLKISLSDQRAQLLSDGVVAMDYPVSTGRSSHPTDTGDFQILEKIKDKRSNTYGKIYDASGNLVNGDADARKDEIPAGGKYVGASMPYWMRFTWTGIGHHIGRVPRYPASHGCIRGTRSVLPTIYEKVKVGTPVTITP
ncbi:MAG: L,D-transpeptidase family protein [Verrucomicrobiota bacterium]